MLIRRRSVVLAALLIVGLALTACADIERGRFGVGSHQTVSQGGQLTWTELAAQPGLRTAVEMSSLSDIQTGGTGTTVIQGPVHFTYDATENAMKITINADMAAPGIAWTKSLAYANQFVEGDDLWLQFDVKWDAAYSRRPMVGARSSSLRSTRGFRATGSIRGAAATAATTR